jgi:hypothetical protein
MNQWDGKETARTKMQAVHPPVYLGDYFCEENRNAQ